TPTHPTKPNTTLLLPTTTTITTTSAASTTTLPIPNPLPPCLTHIRGPIFITNVPKELSAGVSPHSHRKIKNVINPHHSYKPSSTLSSPPQPPQIHPCFASTSITPEHRLRQGCFDPAATAVEESNGFDLSISLYASSDNESSTLRL
ncbi:hypothetical protein PIB30_107767, partial [Stylosanthes scabra]|nr:hypothetical protein [Stylosanthes scabra]